MSFFEATECDIADLNDVQLKELLRRLLEAEATKMGIPASGITAGGDQRAPDGGADAMIEWTGMPEPGEWLRRRQVAFQAKAEGMPPSKIKPEMCPRGRPRHRPQEESRIDQPGEPQRELGPGRASTGGRGEGEAARKSVSATSPLPACAGFGRVS
jgi:hypothetical protein